MEKYYDVIVRTLELLDSMEEGLMEVKKQLFELRYEDSLVIFTDVLEAMISIKDATLSMNKELPLNQIDKLSIAFRDNIRDIITNYEQGQEVELEKKLTENIIPSFNKWSQEIKRVLIPYISS